MFCFNQLLFFLSRAGSGGPLCSACLDGYIYDSAERICGTCASSNSFAVAVMGVGAVLVAIACGLYIGVFALPACIAHSALVGAIRTMDSGTFRIVWSTYQIVQSISWNIEVKLPEPFATFQNMLSLVSFDFLSPGDFRINFMKNSYV